MISFYRDKQPICKNCSINSRKLSNKELQATKNQPNSPYNNHLLKWLEMPMIIQNLVVIFSRKNKEHSNLWNGKDIRKNKPYKNLSHI